MRMRVSLARTVVTCSVLSFVVGCTMPSMSAPWKKLSFRSKKSAESSSSAVATAPTAPSFNSATAAAPQVSMGAVQTSANMPVYPGTTYPVTPYPASATQSAVAANPPAYPAYSAYPDPAAGQQNPAGGQPTNPYVAANPAAPYAPPQNAPYDPAATPVAPYNAAPAGSYTR
jgi:nicotinate-nucleotide--dimethylbenzimidazole phosphoribosyltransferase